MKWSKHYDTLEKRQLIFMEKVGLEDGMSPRASEELWQYENRCDSDNEITFDSDNESNVGGCDSDGYKQHLLSTSGGNILRES